MRLGRISEHVTGYGQSATPNQLQIDLLGELVRGEIDGLLSGMLATGLLRVHCDECA